MERQAHRQSPLLKSLTGLVFIVAITLFIQWSYMNEYPTHVHAWAEQDHYALALGFINNGFDLFHPETMIYNKQFPSWWKEASESTITAVDFPIHEYIVALLMKLLGTTSPWVFRLWTLLWGMLGMFFLFKIAYRLTDDWLKSVLVVGIALTSPVYAYFINGFLPGAPALSLGIIGMWFYLRHFDGLSRKDFHLCVACLTLAMLIRTTFAIELIAILCFELVRIFHKESTFIDKLPSVIASLIAFTAYYLWNKHLRLLYGSVFLNELLPPSDWDDAKELIADTYHKWKFLYFQKTHYIVFLFVILSAAITTLWRSIKGKAVGNKSTKTLSLWWLPLIELLGCLLFGIAMMQQLPNHDYYLIDTAFLPILVLLALTAKVLPKPQNKFIIGAAYIIVGLLCVVMVSRAKRLQMERRYWEQYATVSYNNFMGSDLLLDSLNVSRDAKILCLYGYAQNGPFIQMGRKGYTVMTDDETLLDVDFTWDFVYVVVENEKYAKYLEKRYTLLSGLTKTGGNSRISVYTASRE